MNKNQKVSLGVGLGLLAVAGIGFLASKKTEGGEIPGPQPGKANLYGYVIDNSTEAGLAGTKVLLGGVSTFTNAGGAYFFLNVEPGTYDLVCSKSGYQTITTSVELLEGNNIKDIRLVPSGGIPTPVLEYASGIEFTEPGSHGGMAQVPISVKIKNIGGAAATAHPIGEVKTYLENNGDPYPRYLTMDMGTQSIAPGQTVTFTGSISEYPDEHILLVTIQSEAGVISSEFEDVARLVSLDMPSSLVSEQEYWAQAALRLPFKANRCYQVHMYLYGDYGTNFSTIKSTAIKASLMPVGAKASLTSYYLHGAGDYTVKGVWVSDGTKQVQHQARATYALAVPSGGTIDKALPAGVYKLKLVVQWIEFYVPNVYGQSGILLTQDLGTIAVQAAPGLPTGIYNMSGPASANYGTQVNMTANVRNGSPAAKTLKVKWMTDVSFVPPTETDITLPANSEQQSSYSFAMPPIMWTWNPYVRVWCRLYDGNTLVAMQEASISTTPQPSGVFICPVCGMIFNYPPPANNEYYYEQHMATH
ncbi:MAG: carboxypeptidase-like regulatory domain-containing protein [Synergistaceae bacterium]|jgi:hypothetical protein|nr:carboxypeptidase-like regulatory domain-containing protein [Synergistaceae bacterium]